MLSRRVLNITPNFFGASMKCAKCDTRFTDSTEYRRHLIENHLSPRGNRNRITSHLELAEILANNKNCIAEQIDDEAEGIRLDEYKCSLCKEKFAEKSQLFDHTANIHHKLLMYECSKCAQMFVHRLALTRHLQVSSSSRECRLSKTGSRGIYVRSKLGQILLLVVSKQDHAFKFAGLLIVFCKHEIGYCALYIVQIFFQTRVTKKSTNCFRLKTRSNANSAVNNLRSKVITKGIWPRIPVRRFIPATYAATIFDLKIS